MEIIGQREEHGKGDIILIYCRVNFTRKESTRIVDGRVAVERKRQGVREKEMCVCVCERERERERERQR